jgi:DNA-binding CsgD family transcriptional regulator
MAVTAAVTRMGLLEREEALDALRAALAEAGAGRGRLVLVAGEAGVGKTAVVRAFCDEQRRAARVLWGACDALFTPRPLGPFVDIADAWGGVLAEAVEQSAAPHDVAAALLRAAGTGKPTIVVLEDLHWADEATLDTLRLLARSIGRAPLLVVATYRDDELERTHSLRVVLGELVTRNAVEQLAVARLSEAAVAELAELAESVGIDTAELYRQTSGNPFFVTEALASGDRQIPESVRAAVLGRAARLGQAARDLLEAVAISPQRVEVWLLDELAGEHAEALEECLSSGMLVARPGAVEFRHELARLAIEEALEPRRRQGLHRRALAALGAPPAGAPDTARLAHHAEAAADTVAVLAYAPVAGARAEAVRAHREAAAQYERALRFADGLPARERAELLECRARACLVTDQYDEGIAALEEEVECRRALGDRLKEGDAHRRLSEFLWCPGRTAEADRSARAGVALLEGFEPTRELAVAYANLAHLCLADSRAREANVWARRSLALAERHDDTETAVHALTMIGASAEDYETLEESLERARRAGLDYHAARAYVLLAGAAVGNRRHDLAGRYVDLGVAYATDHGQELLRLYLLSSRARLELDEGRWTEAADSADAVLRIPRTSTTPRIVALVVLALVRARRGDPEVAPLLDEAWGLAEPTGELGRLGRVAVARAEAAWLVGDREALDAATAAALPLALEREDRWLIGELSAWRRRAGIDETAPSGAAEPYALELAGDSARASELWSELGCPYEAALALGASDEVEPLRRALEELRRLEAAPAAAIVARRLRERGVRSLPRGPRPRTRRNEAQLTPRELDVLSFLAEGLTNAAIADRLYLSRRTVDYHVSALLRKLEAGTRGEAVAAARRLGLLDDEDR